VRGFQTYFLAEAKTEDAARWLEWKQAIRFEDADDSAEQAGGLDFILKDPAQRASPESAAPRNSATYCKAHGTGSG
jgi:hypothetical protein